MKIFEDLQNVYENMLLEYFIDGAKAYYMTDDGKIHNVDTDHIDQIINDYELNDDINSFWNDNYGEDPDWDKDWDDIAYYVKDFKKEQGILFLVFDIKNRILYVRGHKNDPNDIQRKSLINFAIAKNSELDYDPMVIA